MFIHNVSERPRMIMNPASCGPGIMTCLSSIFYEPLRRLMPGFIQGYDHDGQLKLMKKHLKDGWDYLNIDGSAFDST